jgi:hypothetical protein
VAIDLTHLLRLRPFAFHTSGKLNFYAIEKSRTLRSTSDLLRGSDRTDLLRGRRLRSEDVELPDGVVCIRDHRPLRPRSIQLETGCSLEDYVDLLNARVFLWLGTRSGPNRPGRAHASIYAAEGEIFTLRIPLRALLDANRSNHPYVARCNSGAARHVNGQPVPRGPSTFRLLHQAEFPAREAIQLSFIQTAHLPPETEFASCTSGPWRTLQPVA